ncbi:MAG: sugar ABC transporter permease [Pyrinomonadaceae bacterium]|nr:sugar ABC transporter permease [Phycisphaerales bacterium]
MLRGLLWISPWIIGFVVFLGVPTLMSLYYSMTDSSLLEKPVFVGLDNYRELMGDAMFLRVVRNTLFYAVGAVVTGALMSISLAVLLEQRLRGRELVRAVIFLPTLVPAVSAVVCWSWLYNPEYGLINSALSMLDVRGPDWMGDRRLAMPALIFMSVWVVGSALTVYTAAMRDTPRSLYEAADIDGVTPWGRFRHITLPMISPAILFNSVMSMIWAVQIFAAPHIMTKGGPENSTYSYSMYVYFNAFFYGRMGYASALAWIQIIATVVLTAVVLRATRGLVFYRGS